MPGTGMPKKRCGGCTDSFAQTGRQQQVSTPQHRFSGAAPTSKANAGAAERRCAHQLVNRGVVRIHMHCPVAPVHMPPLAAVPPPALAAVPAHPALPQRQGRREELPHGGAQLPELRQRAQRRQQRGIALVASLWVGPLQQKSGKGTARCCSAAFSTRRWGGCGRCTSWTN